MHVQRMLCFCPLLWREDGLIFLVQLNFTPNYCHEAVKEAKSA